MTLLEFATDFNAAGHAFCGGCWAWIKAFAFIAVMATLLRVMVRQLVKAGD